MKRRSGLVNWQSLWRTKHWSTHKEKPVMETLFRDVRYGIRSLLKRPAFTAIVIITLALGIGANTAIFSLVNATLLRPLPFKDSDQLVVLWGTVPQVNRRPLSEPNFLDSKERNHVFDHIAAFSGA